MDWSDGYIAADWGTTNRRAFRVSGTGELVERFEDDQGLLALAGGGFEAAVDEIRQRLGDRPMLLAGMIGSNRGWREAPYVDCPAGAESLAQAILWVEPGRTGIVPGVCQREPRHDVMRGEEVQAIGAVTAGMIPADAVVCHPGTHSKWIRMRDGRIGTFRTVMTGELFGLLKDHSILADLLQGKVADGPAGRAAARHALGGAEPIAALFGIRARALLGQGTGDAASFASGLLIGADVRAGLETASERPIALVGRPDLCALYAAALEEAGLKAALVDGDRAFLAGMKALTEKL